MGSHCEFKRRYPGNFEIFSSADYKKSHSCLSDKNRQLLAEYDNTILYNDYVVYRFFETLRSEEAVALYFSDHALDVFESSNDYIGHALYNPVSTEYGRHIPLLVYATDLYRDKFPQMWERINNAADTSYRTDSIMYTVMELAGVEQVNGVSYAEKSLFTPRCQ